MSEKQRRICPECGYEYEPWVEICPDCGVLIVTVDEEQGDGKQAVLGVDEDPRWTVVTNVPNAIIGTLIKSQLEDAGIPVLMRRSASADIAQFSGNDFVPQDLLVPESKKDLARTLLDSRPSADAAGPYWSSSPWAEPSDTWEDDQDTDPADREADLDELRRLWNTEPESGSPAQRDLPEGWVMLPTERDVRARTRHQRTHGEEAGDWQEQPLETGHDASPFESPYGSDRGQWQTHLGRDYARPVQPPRLQRIEATDYDSEGWGGTPRWVRICYGILLLAISLPFIFQIFQQLASLFP